MGYGMVGLQEIALSCVWTAGRAAVHGVCVCSALQHVHISLHPHPIRSSRRSTIAPSCIGAARVVGSVYSCTVFAVALYSQGAQGGKSQLYHAPW